MDFELNKEQVFYRLRDPRLLQLTAITRELFCRME